MHKIIVAIDSSPYSQEVLDWVCARRWAEGTEFKLVTVLEPFFADVAELDELDTVSIEHKRHDAAVKFMSHARERLLRSLDEVTVHFEVRQGKPKEEILKAATEWGSSTIVVGAHGHGVCPHFLLGSVSQAVAANAKCHVEIVRGARSKQAASA